MLEFFGRGGALKPSWYGDCLPSRDFPMLIDLYLQGRLDLDRFVSETIPLDGVEEAFAKMQRGEVLAIGGGALSFVQVDKPHPHVSLVTLNRPERMNAMAFDVMIPFRDALARDRSRQRHACRRRHGGRATGSRSGADHEDAGIVPNIDGLTVPTIALRAMELLDDVITTIRKHAPARDRCGQRRRDRRRVLPGAGVRRPDRIAKPRTSAPPGSTTASPRASSGSATCFRARSGRRVPSRSCCPAVTSTPRRPSASAWCRRSSRRRQLFDACYALADRMIGFSRPGIELTKRMLWDSPRRVEPRRPTWTTKGIAQLFVRLTTQNFEESVRARKEKRPPIFRD